MHIIKVMLQSSQCSLYIDKSLLLIFYTVNSPDSAAISRQNFLSTVVVFSIVSLACAVLRIYTCIIDPSLVGWTFTSRKWFYFTAGLVVWIFCPTTCKRAAVSHKTIENKWRLALFCYVDKRKIWIDMLLSIFLIRRIIGLFGNLKKVWE